MKKNILRAGRAVVLGGILFLGMCFSCGAEKEFFTVDEAPYSYGTYSDYIKQKGNGKDADDLKLYEFLTILEINHKRPVAGTYETIGFVARVYTCPECPEGAMCKPCLGNYIVISAEPAEFDFSSLMDKQMILFTEEGAEFRKGKKYNFLIKALDVKTTDQPINNFQLIHSERIN